MEKKPESNTGAKVYDMLLKRIAAGEWKPGEKIPSENQLKMQLGVSRITIREAMQKLSALGIIETKQGKGSYLKAFGMDDRAKALFPTVNPSDDDIAHLLEYRLILEVGAIKLAVERAQAGDVELLTQYTLMMGNHLTDFETYAYYDALFHQKLLQMSGNILVAGAGNAIRELLEKTIKSLLDPDYAANGVIAHTRIIQAISQGNAEMGVKAAKAMLESAAAALKERREQKT